MLSDDSYRRQEIDKIQGGFIKIKIKCITGETKWISLAQWEFDLIKPILRASNEHS